MRFLPVIVACAVLGLASCNGRSEEAAQALPVGTEVGHRHPPLQGLAADGGDFELAAGRREPTVVLFYRGADCGLCRLRLEQLQAHLPAYRRSGARVIAVTLDPPEVSRRLIDGMQLDFPVISVPPEVFQEWEVLHPEHGLPLPAAYILDRSGAIRFRHIGRNAADRTTDAGLLTVLESLNGAA
jgi:peroxiredoxin